MRHARCGTSVAARPLRHSFGIDEGPAGPSGTEPPTVADVGYEYVRLGALGSFELVGRLSLDLELAWLFVRDLGELGSTRWFPRAEGAGAEAHMGLRFALGRGFEARLAGRWRRYFMSMRSEPGDAHVAGGAVDQYLAMTLGLGWRM